MSIFLSCFRSHLCKHLARTSFSGRHGHVLAQPPTSSPLALFSSLSSFKSSELRNRRNFKRCNSTAANFSTSPSSSETPVTTTATSSYLSVHIRCRKDVSDMLSEALLCFGANSTSTDEQEDLDENDEVKALSMALQLSISDKRTLTDLHRNLFLLQICLSSIFSEFQNVEECISLAADSIGLKEKPNYEVVKHDHYDWIKETQDSFHPVEVAQALWVVPEWRTPPDAEATNIILNPGLAFGTGEHPTTKLCLLLLHGLIKGGEHFLDYGTGSGILAIAAIKFGAASSVGFDIDPQAITSAKHNASLNNIEPEKLYLQLVHTNCADEKITGVSKVIIEKEKYDIVIANILLNPLLDLADEIVSYAKPGAVIGLSGIISDQVPRIIERYSQFVEDITVSKMDDWACITGFKKRNVSV